MFHLDFLHVDALQSSLIAYLGHTVHGVVKKKRPNKQKMRKTFLTAHLFLTQELTLGNAQIFSFAFERIVLQNHTELENSRHDPRRPSFILFSLYIFVLVL